MDSTHNLYHFIFPKPIKNTVFWENKAFKFPRIDIFYTFAGK